MEKTALHLGPDDVATRLTRDEFAEATFQPPYRYERVRGRLVVMTPAGPQHRSVARPFARKLHVYWDEHMDIVEFVDIEGWVATSEDDDRLPDICVYLLGPATGQDVPERVPDLVFEFVSQSRADQERDYITKRDEYHQIGVREYVIVDRFKQAVTVLTWQPADYAERVIAADASYTTPLLPGLEVDLREVFRSP